MPSIVAMLKTIALNRLIPTETSDRARHLLFTLDKATWSEVLLSQPWSYWQRA